MAKIENLFVTRLYRAELGTTAPAKRLIRELDDACRSTADEDVAGQRWCDANAYPGYTSYASLNDLPWRYPCFADLVNHLETHAGAFAKKLEWDLQGKPITLDSLWINCLPPGGFHSSHIHPNSVLSGTFYVNMPKGAAALKIEDPRSGLMMAAPPKKKTARRDQQPFIYESPAAGTILMWESWLRHEVPMNAGKDARISISFNFRWGD
jgi:uncharacterized protein (TIGR02466 family)